MPNDRLANPFAAVKAEELDDETILQWFEWPGAIGRVPIQRHQVLYGGRGSGKTMCLKYMSHAVQRLRRGRGDTPPALPVATYCDLRNLEAEFVDPSRLADFEWRSFVGYVSLYLLRELALTFDQCLSDGLIAPTISSELSAASWQTITECGVAADTLTSIASSADDLMAKFRRGAGGGAAPTRFAYALLDFRRVNHLCVLAARHLAAPQTPRTILILLDQYDDLEVEQQRVTNLLFRNPTPRGYHLIVGVRPWGLKTHDVAIGGHLRAGNDYVPVSLDFPDSADYEKLLAAICSRRLDVWQHSHECTARTDIGDYLGDAFETYARLSSGIVHQFMLLCEEAFDRAFQTNSTLVSSPRIPDATLDLAIATVSTRQTKDLLGSIVGYPEKAKLLVNYVCSVASNAAAPGRSAGSDVAFQLRSINNLDLENKEALRLCLMDSVFQDLPGADEYLDQAITVRVNRILWRAKKLDHENAGTYTVEADVLNDRMRPFVPKAKDKGASLFDADWPSVAKELAIAPLVHRHTWIGRLNHVTQELNAHGEVLAQNLQFSCSLLDSLEKKCMEWAVGEKRLLPDTATRLAVVFGGSFGRLEAARSVSDADFFILTPSASEVVEGSIVLFNLICQWLREKGVSVETSFPVAPSTPLASFEDSGFPKIVDASFPTSAWEKPGEKAEAKTLRLVMMTEGTAVYNQGMFQKILSDLRNGYRFHELAQTNSLQKVFLTDFKEWCGTMWNRIYIRDKTGELAWIKVELHREFLRRSTALAMAAHVCGGDELAYSTQHEVLSRPPFARLASIEDRLRLDIRKQVRERIRNVVSDYNDSQKVVCDPELREYWENPRRQLEMEKAQNARLVRLTEQVRAINQHMLREFDRLRDIVLSELTGRDRADFESCIGW